MKSMLTHIQDHPVIAMVVLLLLFSIFAVMAFLVFRKSAKKHYDEAASLPLSQEES